MARAIKKFSLSSIPWGTVAKVGVGVGAVYAVVRIVRTLFPLAPRSVVEVAKMAAEQLVAQGVQPTYTDVFYAAMADIIEQAGFYIGGTDEEAIFSVFEKIQNDLDLVKLFEAFGQRPVSWIRDANLGGFLWSELTQEEMKKVNEILSANGVKTQF